MSQRLPISTLELMLSSAERRALVHSEALALPRVSDLFAALPGITGKLELEYEGEMRGADTVVRELIHAAVGKIFDQYFAGTDTQSIEQWFNLGGTVKLDDQQSTSGAFEDLKQIHGLFDRLAPLGIQAEDRPERVVAAAEFLLEGMVAHRKISRSEERVFKAQDRTGRVQDRPDVEREFEEWERGRRNRGSRGGYN